MCGRCISFIYDDVAEMARRLEASMPLNIAPDWPARPVPTFPKSRAALIVPAFDTAYATFDSAHATFDTADSSFDAARATIESTALAGDRLGAQELSWGFEESWRPGVIFNTRIESADKPTWRESMEHRRCLIPVSTFFETSQDETHVSPTTGRQVKTQYEFRVPGQDVMLIGCIRKGDAFSMVTTAANSDMERIHHRMPLVVRQNEIPIWFGPDYLSLADRSSIALEAQRAL